MHAVLLGFGVPLFILLAVLVPVLRLTGSEGVAALTALGALVAYFAVLWLLRSRISRRVSFLIEEVRN